MPGSGTGSRTGESVTILVDVNLSPKWIPYLQQAGFEAIFWSTVGAGEAPDYELLRYAAESQWIIMSRDLDFGIMLAREGRTFPSLIQLRLPEPLPATVGALVLLHMENYREELAAGALLTIGPNKTRIRALPVS